MQFTDMRSTLLFIYFLLLASAGFAQSKFDAFTQQFVSGYSALRIAELQLGYADNFKLIKSADSIRLQANFFKDAQNQLGKFNYNKLSETQQQDYQLIKYESAINLERLGLEKNISQAFLKNTTLVGLYSMPDGKQWYAYFLKRWLSDTATPDQIYAFGLKEVEDVEQHIKNIQQQSGLSEDAFYKHLNDSTFFINNPATVQQAFERDEQVIMNRMDNLFTNRTIPKLSIKRSTNKMLMQAPGYYDDNTFYYTLFDKPYNKRQVDWLFMHEAIPGHHYQLSIADATQSSQVQKLFNYPGFAEGWGAYTESLGKDLGLYQTMYDELGRWEWDIVRSVRVPMDIGINYYGWTDDQALAFWKKHIRNQDDIAMREIKRVRRWPVQAITYKYGAAQILKWKAELQKQQGQKFDIKDFHNRILSHGSLPLFLVKENVNKKG
ncbi:DUF885 domain-containing protein [Mucilaginibacter agri]|uniref:DUF885 family protein n=1 Tax=Mucilaginibacter agri TaxID=2695265 RepID=A0A965ZJ79_9SPHI|nr:DUF885 domain-containing protein [Mucilaginibacter agri]NCD70681.1 DUF885 family protein [Mucilaginibacter agri]